MTKLPNRVVVKMHCAKLPHAGGTDISMYRDVAGGAPVPKGTVNAQGVTAGPASGRGCQCATGVKITH